MITAIHRSMFLPVLVMLLALAGMSLSVIGEASSHGVAELTGASSMGHDEHPHSHDDVDEKSDDHVHHDTGNHSHESVDYPTIRPVSGAWMSLRQATPYVGDSPRSFRYRLERPPKAS